MRARGLSDLRTATSSRLHAKPPQKGAEYLNLYLLDKESQRLETELAGLEHRRKRIQAHLEEIRKAMGKAHQGAQGAQQERLFPSSVLVPPGPDKGGCHHPQWKKMAVDY